MDSDLKEMEHSDFARACREHADFEEGRGNDEAAAYLREAAMRILQLEGAEDF